MQAPASDQASLSAPSWGVSSSSTAKPFRLLHVIGEGRMGEVWVAQQFEPVKGRVALSAPSRPGWTRTGSLRFEAVRKALAMMDHRAIAKVLDAGTTAGGQLLLCHGVRVGCRSPRMIAIGSRLATRSGSSSGSATACG